MPAYVLTDLTYGDAGKGTIVDALCCRSGINVHTIVRTGGHHAGHNVVFPDGSDFTFSQFGSGTFSRAQTFLSKYMVIEPFALFNEAEALRKAGIANPLAMMFIDGEALVTTPYHKAVSRLKEMVLTDRLGSVGLGVGETVLDSEAFDDWAVIRAKDLNNPKLLAEKLEDIRVKSLHKVDGIFYNLKYLPREMSREAAVLLDIDWIPEIVKRYTELAKSVQIVDSSYLYDCLYKLGDVIFEPSQGVLLDRWYGFHPYTTKVGTTGSEAMDLLSEFHYGGRIYRIGITRAYATRHGPGPFVTEDRDLAGILPDKHNPANQWQLNFRVGYLDLVSLKYALECCGGPQVFSGLAVTCLDQRSLISNVCDSYKDRGASLFGNDSFFSWSNDQITGIKVRPNTRNQEQLDYQQKLGEVLYSGCFPNLVDIPDASFLPELGLRLGVPVSIESNGSTYQDKTFHPFRNTPTS